jgi:hypothetical protein
MPKKNGSASPRIHLSPEWASPTVSADKWAELQAASADWTKKFEDCARTIPPKVVAPEPQGGRVPPSNDSPAEPSDNPAQGDRRNEQFVLPKAGPPTDAPPKWAVCRRPEATYEVLRPKFFGSESEAEEVLNFEVQFSSEPEETTKDPCRDRILNRQQGWRGPVPIRRVADYLRCDMWSNAARVFPG